MSSEACSSRTCTDPAEIGPAPEPGPRIVGRSDRSWMARAACTSVDPELFFPSAERGSVYREQVEEAKKVCRRCPVRDRCLAEALIRLPYGIAGGLTPEERRRTVIR